MTAFWRRESSLLYISQSKMTTVNFGTKTYTHTLIFRPRAHMFWLVVSNDHFNDVYSVFAYIFR